MTRGNRDKFGTGDQGRNPCDLIITGGTRKGEPMNVRCYCMAPYGANKERSLRYDRLGVAHSLREARALWDRHVERRKIQDAGQANLTEL